MTANRLFLGLVISLFFLPSLSVAMPGRSGGNVLLDSQGQILLQAELDALGVNIRPSPHIRPPAYRRSFSEPSLLVHEPAEPTPPIKRRHKRKKKPPAEHSLEDAEEISLGERLQVTEPDVSELRSHHIRRQKLKRALSHRHLANEDSEDLFDVTTALFASQIDAPLETFLREPNEVKSRFFQLLREQQFSGHRLGRLMLFHIRFDKLLQSAFIKALKSQDGRSMSENFAAEVLAQLEKVKVNEETMIALNRLLELANQKIEESHQDLSAQKRQLLAQKMVINALGLYLLGPVALESSVQNAVEPFRNIMATLAYEPDNTNEGDEESRVIWDAWINILDRLRGE